MTLESVRQHLLRRKRGLAHGHSARGAGPGLIPAPFGRKEVTVCPVLHPELGAIKQPTGELGELRRPRCCGTECFFMERLPVC